MRILLVRHGQSTDNAAGRFVGRIDPPLSDEKLTAIQSMSAGTATKLVLAFRRTRKGTVFWPPTSV